MVYAAPLRKLKYAVYLSGEISHETT